MRPPIFAIFLRGAHTNSQNVDEFLGVPWVSSGFHINFGALRNGVDSHLAHPHGFSQALILGASVAAAPSGSQPGCQGGADEQIFVWKHYGMWFLTGSWMLLVPK
jgi:hypothetical protein